MRVASTGRRAAAGRREHQGNVLPLGLRAHLLHRGLGDLGEIRAAELDVHGSRMRLGQEQQILDQAQQALRVPLDDLRVLVGVDLAGALVPEQLHVPDNRRQRRPELVRDQADEFVFHPVKLAQPLVLHAQLLSLVKQGLLGPDLGRDVTRDPERPDDFAGVITKCHLCRRNPRIRAVAVGLQLHLADERLTGADDFLLILEGRRGMLLAEDVEVRLPDQFVCPAARGVRGDPALADQQEPAQPVLEVHPLLARGQQVAHAGELEATRVALPRFLRLRPGRDHRNPPWRLGTRRPATTSVADLSACGHPASHSPAGSYGRYRNPYILRRFMPQRIWKDPIVFTISPLAMPAKPASNQGKMT